MKLRLLDVTSDDLPQIGQWLQADQVRQYWGDPGENIRQLRDAPGDGHWRAIIEADGRKVGLVLWQHPTRQELDVAGLTDIPESVIDIDIMIGEQEAVGRGAGSAALRLVAETALCDPGVPFAMACIRVGNVASLRACVKAGFHRDREFDDVPNGRYMLMVCHRQPTRSP